MNNTVLHEYFCNSCQNNFKIEHLSSGENIISCPFCNADFNNLDYIREVESNESKKSIFDILSKIKKYIETNKIQSQKEYYNIYYLTDIKTRKSSFVKNTKNGEIMIHIRERNISITIEDYIKAIIKENEGNYTSDERNELKAFYKNKDKEMMHNFIINSTEKNDIMIFYKISERYIVPDQIFLTEEEAYKYINNFYDEFTDQVRVESLKIPEDGILYELLLTIENF